MQGTLTLADRLLDRTDVNTCLDCGHIFYEYQPERVMMAAYAVIGIALVLLVLVLASVSFHNQPVPQAFRISEAAETERGTDPVSHELLEPARWRQIFRQLRIATLEAQPEKNQTNP